MADTPAPEPLDSLKKRLLNCNPLASLGMKIFGEASSPDASGVEQGAWGVRRNCAYEVTAGMLPETTSAFVRDADENRVMGLAFEFRRTAIEELMKILDVDYMQSTIVTLDSNFDGDVEVLVSPEWNAVVQGRWSTSEYSDFSLFRLSYLIIRR